MEITALYEDIRAQDGEALAIIREKSRRVACHTASGLGPPVIREVGVSIYIDRCRPSAAALAAYDAYRRS